MVCSSIGEGISFDSPIASIALSRTFMDIARRVNQHFHKSLELITVEFCCLLCDDVVRCDDQANVVRFSRKQVYTQTQKPYKCESTVFKYA